MMSWGKLLRFGRIAALVFVVIGALLLFALGMATASNAKLSKYLDVLLWLNWVVAVGMVFGVLLIIIRLVLQYRSGVFGSRLMVRLTLFFVLIGVVPALLIYQMSMQFLARNIESWYSVQVENALDSGLSLGRTVFDVYQADTLKKTQEIAVELSRVPLIQTIDLNVLRSKYGFYDLMILDARGQPELLAASNSSLIFPLLSSSVIQEIRKTGQYTTIENLQNISGQNFIRAVVPIGEPIDSQVFGRQYKRFVHVLQPIPINISSTAENVQRVQRDYNEFSLSRDGLRKIFMKTLQFGFIYFACLAIMAAFLLSRWLTKPLLYLSHGTKAVAAGDFSQIDTINSRDELGVLTREFSQMTRQLEDARTTVEKNQHELNQAKGFLEKILASLSTGVLVFDENFMLLTFNRGAERILGVDLAPVTHQSIRYYHRLDVFANDIELCFAEYSALNRGKDFWQKQLSLMLASGDKQAGHDDLENDKTSLLVRGSNLTLDHGVGHVVVFDDISQLVSAQRAVAWSEVARRLAHEIKNPLTPIQLSAERLQHKLEGKLVDPERAMLVRSTATIVNQVTAMKRMVDDFREYAKTPSTHLELINLNELIYDVLQLYGGIENSLFSLSLSVSPPMLEGDATHLRQVLHNLLQNAQDALVDTPNPNILISTAVIGVLDRGGKQVQRIKLTIEDNGTGFSSKLLDCAFEPYVTTKAHGTGLGLAIVKKMIEAHHGQIELSNRSDADGKILGATVFIVFA